MAHASRSALIQKLSVSHSADDARLAHPAHGGGGGGGGRGGRGGGGLGFLLLTS
jgi:hypothetical protein